MSWLVMIYNVSTPPPTPQSVQEDDLSPLGTRADVLDAISEALPGVDWRDPSWGSFHGDGFALEFVTGTEDVLEVVSVRVTGGGDPISALLGVATPHGWSLMDTSTTLWIDPDDPSYEGWESFQAYRDQVI